MKKLLLLPLCCLTMAAFAVDAVYFVDAAGGDDANDGSELQPVKSLARVCDLIAAQSPKAALTTVNVLPGNYGEDAGTDLSRQYAGKNGGQRYGRIVITDAANSRKILFRARDGKDMTHIVGRGDPDAAADKYGCGANAIGGAVCNNSTHVLLDGFTFRDCYAAAVTTDNVDRGGAAYNATLVDCVVSNCVATRGGALQGSTAHRCRLTANRATTSTQGAAANASSLSNCLIDHNVGASVLSYPNEIINCTIVDNDAGAGASVFCQASGSHDICNTLVIGNSDNKVNNCTGANNGLNFKSIVSQGSKTSYLSGHGADAFITVDDACKFGVSPEQFADAAALDYRVTSASDAVGAGLSEYVNRLTPPVWAGYDGKVYDYAGVEIDLTGETVQAGCLQEVRSLPPTVVIDASAADVEVTGGTIGRNFIGTDPIIVTAKRAAARPFLGFAVGGEIVTRESSLDLRTLDVESGKSVTLTAEYGTVWYVNQTGGADSNSGAYPDAAKEHIRAAATNAVSGDVIRVYPGVYGDADGTMMHTTRISSKTAEIRIPSRVVVNAGVTVESVEGPETTFIVGRADSSAGAAYPVFGLGPDAVRCVLLENDATIRGFTITGGRVDKSTSSQYDDNFDCGGILGRNRERCTVVDCVVSNNVADEGGFGMNCTFVRSFIVGNVGVERQASRTCRFYGCFLDDNDNGSMEHVTALDSCTIGPTCRNAAHTKNDVTAIQYPTVGGSFVNSIVLAKNIWENSNTTSYRYSVTNCVFLSSTSSALENDGAHAALCNCTFIENAAAAGLDENFRPVPGQTIAEILDAITPQYEAMTVAETLAERDAGGVARVMNGARDIGAFEGDWRPRYAADLGGRALVTEASPGVVEAAGKVVVPGGSKIVLSIDNRSLAEKEYALDMLVAGGALSVGLDGAPVAFTDAADIRLAVPPGVHSVTIALAGGSADLATIRSLRSQTGLVLLLK